MSVSLDDGFVVDEPCDGFVSPLPDDSEPEGFVGVAGVVLAGLSAGEPSFVELDGLLGVTGLSVPLDGLSLCAGLFTPLPDDSEPEGLTGVDGVVSPGLFCELFDGLSVELLEPLIDCPLLLVLLSLLPAFCVCVVSVFAFIFFV